MEVLGEYSTNEIKRVSNASMVGTKRKFPEAPQRRSRKTTSGYDKKSDDISRAKVSSRRGRVNVDLEPSSGKRNSRGARIASTRESCSDDELLADEFEEGELLFLFKLKQSGSRGRSRNSLGIVTIDESPKVVPVENCEPRDTAFCPSPPPASSSSSANSDTKEAVSEVEVISIFVHLLYSLQG